MSAGSYRAGASSTAGACQACLRRSWLLAQLIAPLDYCARDRERLLAALALEDAELLAALAGRRRGELRVAWEGWRADMLEPPGHEASTCRHLPAHPLQLRADSAPHALFVAGGTQRLARLAQSPVVAVLGASRASDYGMAIAASLARELTASGATVAAPLAAGVGFCALHGARELGAAAIAVSADGLCSSPARAHPERHAAAELGCVISELPPHIRGRRFGELAAGRTLAHLADVVLVVEARADASEVAGASALLQAGCSVAAVPGRATSTLASGPHALIRNGATLVRDARDVLELLPAGRAPRTPVRVRTQAAGPAGAALTRPLAAVLERVGDGCDTAERLCAEALDPDQTLLALSELEVMGLLRRGAEGRYVIRATPRK